MSNPSLPTLSDMIITLRRHMLTLFSKTTGKSLEDIDLLFAKPELRDSALAARVMHKEVVMDKDQMVQLEEKEDV